MVREGSGQAGSITLWLQETGSELSQPLHDWRHRHVTVSFPWQEVERQRCEGQRRLSRPNRGASRANGCLRWERGQLHVDGEGGAAAQSDLSGASRYVPEIEANNTRFTKTSNLLVPAAFLDTVKRNILFWGLQSLDESPLNNINIQINFQFSTR